MLDGRGREGAKNVVEDGGWLLGQRRRQRREESDWHRLRKLAPL